ncbi:MAG: hypothetical protein ACT4QD_11240 [Acidobacteriota bacterium]
MKKISNYVGLVMFLLLTAACGSQPGMDKLEVGQEVAVTKADGGVVEGTVASVDDTTVHVTAGQSTKLIPKDQIVDVRVIDETRPTALPPAAKFREYTVPPGTTLSLRLVTAINSGTARVEDAVEATLAEAVSVGGADVLPAGSILKGSVAAVEGSGRVKGLASIAVHFTGLAAAGRDDHYDIDATYVETAEATKGKDATKIGIGSGAAIGGLLGGKGGAAKGAAIGGGAGTAVVLSTKGEEVERPVGARLTVRLEKAIDVCVFRSIVNTHSVST